MSYGFQYKPLEFPMNYVTDPYGNQTSYSGGSYPSGYYTYSKAESVRRPRPDDLRLLSSLTPYGGHDEETMQYGKFDYMIDAGGWILRSTDVNGQAYIPVGQSISADEPDWETKLRLAVKDQKVNLAQTMAEYRQCQNMFATNATTIVKALRQLKRGDVRGLGKTLGILRHPKFSPKLRTSLANKWLEVQYGWKPLLQDISGSVEEVNANLNRPHYRKVSIRATNEARNERHVLLPGGAKATAVDTDKVTISAKAIILGESLSVQRLGFTNPAALAWELLPYSFVIDWLIPIGDWLNGLDALVGVQQCYGTVTRKRKYISTSTVGGYYLRRQYGRTVFDSLPGSNAYPRWKPSVGFGRVANALALLSQLKR